jgi:cytoskeletal protein CcmA (bactofilin family)
MDENIRTTESSRLTVVEEGTELSGTVTSNCPVVVRGKVSGELTSPALTVAPSGAVAGKVRVGTILSSGEVSGEIEADHANLSGRIADDTVIRARTLEVKLSSEGRMTLTFGEARLDVGEEPQRP